MIEVIFTKDFANKKKGDIAKCQNSLASTLINLDKVAKVYIKKVNNKQQ